MRKPWTGHTTVNKRVPIHYIIATIHYIHYITPTKKSTIRPSNLVHCGWISTESMRLVFYNQHINKVTPHFSFMRRAQNADTHALKQLRQSQNISPVCSSFVLVTASHMHLESESEKRAKNVDWHTTKNIQIQPTLFRYSYKLTSDLFIVVWPEPWTTKWTGLFRTRPRYAVQLAGQARNRGAPGFCA